MKILLLGVGMQGKAALHDLFISPDVTEIVAADVELAALKKWIDREQYGSTVTCRHVDAANRESIDELMKLNPQVVIDLLPAAYCGVVAESAVEYGIHLVNSLYLRPAVAALAEKALKRGVTILPEFGMDPGIDLVLTGEAIRSFDEISSFISYGAGFPERVAADNPLQYKVTWTFEGVLNSYRRAGRVIRNGKIIDIGDTEMFRPENIHTVDVRDVGTLEAIPNGDALKYAELLGLDIDNLRNLGRYSMRWPGHSAFWKKLVDLHLIDDESIMMDGFPVNKRKFLAKALEPYLQYRKDERDVVVVRVDVTGLKNGIQSRRVFQIIDRRDLDTGFTAMSRTVGFTASIGAQMIGRGDINTRGVLTPVHDVPFDIFIEELRKRGIEVEEMKNDD